MKERRVLKRGKTEGRLRKRELKIVVKKEQ